MTDNLKILFLSRWFPVPVNNGSKLRIYNLLRGLAGHHDVTLLSFVDQPDLDPDSHEIRSLCSDVRLTPWHEFDPNSRRARLGFLGLKPRFLMDTHSEQMESTIRTTLSSKRYDLVIASQLSMASYYPCFGETPAMFEEIELGLFYDGAVQNNNKFKQLRSQLTWLKFQQYLSRLLNSFQTCTLVSEQESQLFSVNFPKQKDKVFVVPNCINFDDYQGLKDIPAPYQLIFTGPFQYRVNYDAMCWFIREVYPKILDQIPETHLVITGDHADLPLPPAPNITLTGYVDDIKSLVASSWVSIVPLLSGGGTRLKILEAMALGTPVVATSKGAQGLEVISEEHILIADSPDLFASHVIRILKDKDLRSFLSSNARQVVKEKYDWAAQIPHFLEVIEQASRG